MSAAGTLSSRQVRAIEAILQKKLRAAIARTVLGKKAAKTRDAAKATKRIEEDETEKNLAVISVEPYEPRAWASREVISAREGKTPQLS